MDRDEIKRSLKQISEKVDKLCLLVGNRPQLTYLADEEDEVYLDNQDVCFMLKISKRTLQRHRSDGLLPYYNIHKKTYYLKSDVLKIIEDSKINNSCKAK